MIDGDALDQRHELADRTSRLVEFLRELAIARLPRLADVRKAEVCLWLSDLRRDVAVDQEAPRGGEVVRARQVDLLPRLSGPKP